MQAIVLSTLILCACIDSSSTTDGALTDGAASADRPANSTDGGGDKPPPQQHGDCAGLGAVDHFEDITPPGFDPSRGTKQGIVPVRVHPVNTGTV